MVRIEFTGQHWLAVLPESRLTHENLASLIITVYNRGYEGKDIKIEF